MIHASESLLLWGIASTARYHPPCSYIPYFSLKENEDDPLIQILKFTELEKKIYSDFVLILRKIWKEELISNFTPDDSNMRESEVSDLLKFGAYEIFNEKGQ